MGKYKYKVVTKNYKSAMIHPRSPYCIDYRVGETVFARADTLGIMVFNTLRAADEWMEGWWDIGPVILRVVPVDRGMKPPCICKEVTTKEIAKFYRQMKNLYIPSDDWNKPVKGTMCYPGVHVISEVDAITYLQEEEYDPCEIS